MKYHRVPGSTGLNDRSRLTGETTEPRWMERMREVLNEFTRFMNPHLRLCSRLSQQQFIFSPNASFERIFSRQTGESIDQHIRSNTKSDKFVAKKDHSSKSRLVVKRYYKSPSRQSCQPCIHFTLLVEEEHSPDYYDTIKFFHPNLSLRTPPSPTNSYDSVASREN